jgi:hypothetical protein
MHSRLQAEAADRVGYVFETPERIWSSAPQSPPCRVGPVGAGGSSPLIGPRQRGGGVHRLDAVAQYDRNDRGRSDS